MADSILVLIHYPTDVGFAVGRLVTVFYDMAVRCTRNPANVHFAFTELRDGRCEDLPDHFQNYVQFEPRNPSPDAIKRLTSYVREHRISVLFGMDMPVQAPYLGKARRSGVKTVISYYGAPLSSVMPWPRLLLKRLEVRLLRRNRPNHFIVESQAMYQTAVQGRGIPRHQVSIVRNGVSLARFSPPPGSSDFVYKLFSIPRHRKVVVYMGHFVQRKGVDVLLRAAHHIVVELGRDDVHFLFLGTRQQDVEAIQRVFDLSSVESHVSLGGYQNRIPDILAGCTIGCIPTTGWDSFPMSPLEMQACNLPVIVSDCQGLPETIADGITGFVIRAGDVQLLAQSILKLVDDGPLRTRMAQAARSRIESELTYDIQVSRLAATVRSVIDSPERGVAR